MTRVNVYSRDPYEEKTLLGWFDTASCVEKIDESTYWDGNNNRGVISGGQVGYEMLYRTKGGRWARYYNFTSEYNGPEFYEFLTDDQARDWLIKDGDDEIVEKYFGELEEERGPGRPEIGKPIPVRLTEDQRAKVEKLGRDGESLSATIRRLIDAAPMG